MLNDIYILLEEFNKQDVTFFMKNYLEDFLPVQDYFEYPPHYGQEIVFETDDVNQMIEFMLHGEKGYFRFYFRSPIFDPIKPNMGMIFFNYDNTLTLGLQVLSEFNEVFINKLMKEFKSELVMICEGAPPPSNKEEFIKIINN